MTTAAPSARRGVVPAGAAPSVLDLSRFPWWGLILIATGLFLTYSILADPTYRQTFEFLAAGVTVTIRITLLAYLLATIIGLMTGLMRTSKNPVLFTISTLYVETARGIQLIVLMLYVAYIIIPAFVSVLHFIGEWGVDLERPFLTPLFTSMAGLSIRQVNTEMRGVIALAIGYGAFEAEIFRAGIQSISRGQMEAARSLGMTYPQAMRYIILPQAIRRVLPPLGNDFIACLKDSSLLTVLAVNELTQLGRLRRASTFRVFETFNVVTYLYLAMTMLLSAVVRFIEQRMRIEE
ncbi:MAG TPA: amino acid ABC transporter permease [Anaerolineales bacterium]|nr:amino acid ABC transporter permease [Anaerolineales bacterium]